MLKTLTEIAAAAALTLAVPANAQEQGMPQMQMPTPSKSGYAPVNGVEIYYQVYGEGEPLVLLHGGFGAIEMFGPALGELAKGRQLIAMDLQAHGRTGPLERTMSFEAMATDVAELIKFLKHEKADVMGYSMGGGVALRTAIDHPEVVDRLVLVSTAFAFSNWHDFNQQGMKGMAGNLEATIEGMKQTPMYQLYSQIARDPETSWPKAVEQVANFVGQDFDWSAEVPSIKAPTLIVVGDWDSVRIGEATRMFEMLGGGSQDANWDRSGMNQNRFAVLPDTTHYEAFMSPLLPVVVTPFLDGYPQSGSMQQAQ